MSNASAGFLLLGIVVCVIMAAITFRLRRDGHPITQARYRVVSTGGGPGGIVKRPGTHVSSSKWPFQTLYGTSAGPNVDVFEPGEVSCRECRRRWERATGVRQT
jgi:hypothetical protein